MEVKDFQDQEDLMMLHRIICVMLLLVVIPTPSAGVSGQKTVNVTSHGTLTGYQMQTLRVHKGTGMDAIGGPHDTLQHLYVGSDIDDDFAGIRIYEANGVTPVVHRRMCVVSRDYADFVLKIDTPAAGHHLLLCCCETHSLLNCPGFCSHRLSKRPLCESI